jgi:tetratricopeptide (TPR) repeat protein
MRRVIWVAGLSLLLASCAREAQERVREYNEDGIRLFQHGEYDHAREEFQAALRLRPGDPELIFNLGKCYERLGQTKQAVQIYQDCLQHDAYHTECRHALTVLLVHNGEQGEAQRLVQNWLCCAYRRADAYAEDGWLYRQAGDPIKAVKRFQQAIDLDPYNNRALVELAEIYEEMHYPERALQLYEQALAVKPEQSDIAKRVAALHARGVGRPHPES